MLSAVKFLYGEYADFIPLNIDAEAAAGDINGEVVSVTVSDIPVGATLNLGGGFTFTATEGNTSVSLTPDMVEGLTISLPEDFDEDFELSVTATAEEVDPETGEVTTATSDPVALDVSVVAQADAPTVETTDASGLEDGGPIALDIDPAAAAEDINGEVTSVTISDPAFVIKKKCPPPNFFTAGPKVSAYSRNLETRRDRSAGARGDGASIDSPSKTSAARNVEKIYRRLAKKKRSTPRGQR